MTTCDTAARLPPGGALAEVKTSKPGADLRDAVLRSAQQGASLLQKVVKQYCVQSEQRAMAEAAGLAR